MKKSSLSKTILQKLNWAIHLTPAEFKNYLHFRKTQLTTFFQKRRLQKEKHSFLKKLQSPKYLKKQLKSPIKESANFFFKIDQSLIKKLKPHQEKILQEAQKILNQEFNLLGSGPKKLTPINWHQDFKSGKTWPLELATEIPYEFNTGNDIKVPWELSRFQFLPTLGQAYILTKDPKYSTKFTELITDWIEKNPLHFGVNWKCTMDVAIRACNWTYAWWFFKDSPEISQEFKTLFYNSLNQHGKFIIRHLENIPFTSNHYLSDIVGLVYLGILFPEFKEAKKWKAQGIKALEEEINKQVYDDGANFEASISYHRLATELFAYSAQLCELNQINLSQNFHTRLTKMLNFTKNYTKPNGLAPMFGDFDDGRLHILSNFSTWNKRDHRYLLNLNSHLDQPAPTPKNLNSSSFPNTGLYIMRSDQIYCAINCGENGQNQNGGHSHNDTFSFELNKSGQDFIVDTGSYIYTPDTKARNTFRSTQMHNTLFINQTEINPINKNRLFYLEENAHPTVLNWNSNQKKDILKAEHHGYQRLAPPLIHQRNFELNKSTSQLTLTDTIKGHSKVTLEWNFHFTPESKIELKDNTLIAKNKDSTLQITFPKELLPKIKKTEISHSYGQKKASQKLTLILNTQIISQKTIIITFQ